MIRDLGRRVLMLGWDPRITAQIVKYPLFLKHKKLWLESGGKITHSLPILTDFASQAGAVRGHYFHQDLLVARFISERNPKRHIDVGSRIDGFVAHVAAFRQIEVLDVRPLRSDGHPNIRFRQADLMDAQNIGETDSLSCLHAIEHFGMGRYGDPININGHIKGIENLISLISKGGNLYISFPIGKTDEVHFNAHRVFHPKSILAIEAVASKLLLERFDYVDDSGNLLVNVEVDDAVGRVNYGCGIYSFKKL